MRQRSNEVLAREGIDTEINGLPLSIARTESSNEVLAREGIDTRRLSKRLRDLYHSSNEVLAREGIDTVVQRLPCLITAIV